MHTLARRPGREVFLKRQASLRAFTLIELLTVIAIIAILAAITFGVIKGVNERAAVAQAKTELSSLAQALEAYKAQYGDYPQTGSGALAPTATGLTAASTQYRLFNSLVGKMGPKGDSISGRSFVEVSRFSTFSTAAGDLPTAGGGVVNNAFVDPWGRLYMYFYKNPASPATWTASGYVLFSAGPSGLVTNPTAAGVVDYTTANNADSIFANR